MNLRKILSRFILLFALALVVSCGSSLNYVQHFNSITADLQAENYKAALSKINLAKKEKLYTQKDRVLYYLDKGLALQYDGKYKESNQFLDRAEQAMEELFTKSVSNIAVSYLLNDNVLDYYGETYENIYVNIFKALNYIHLSQPEEALVEIKRVNNKLRELDEKYGEMATNMNKQKNAPVIKPKAVNFYNDALAQYLGYLIYRLEDEPDDSRISYEKLKEAWRTQPNIYYYNMPAELNRFSEQKAPALNVIAFVGSAPLKIAVGGMITTYKNYIGISDLTQPIALPNIPFPGMKPGYHFKFSFPIIKRVGSRINRIEVEVDGRKAGDLSLLEDMGKVAEETFEARKDMIYLKTLVRTITKGIAAAKAKEKMKEKTNANPLLGALIDAAVDVGVDATEKADLRCWRTMPEDCYVGEFPITPGVHQIAVKFYSPDGLLVKEKKISNFKAENSLNIIDVFSLN